MTEKTASREIDFQEFEKPGSSFYFYSLWYLLYAFVRQMFNEWRGGRDVSV